MVRLASFMGPMEGQDAPSWVLGVCKDEQWTWSEPQSYERDDFFVFQARAFLDALAGEAPPACTLSEAADTLRTILAALRSAAEGRRIVLD